MRLNLKPFTPARFPARNRQGLVLNVQGSFTSRVHQRGWHCAFRPSTIVLQSNAKY